MQWGISSALLDLLEYTKPSQQDLVKHSFTSTYIFGVLHYKAASQVHLSTVLALVNDGPMSLEVPRRAADSGISLEHIKLAHKQD